MAPLKVGVGRPSDPLHGFPCRLAAHRRLALPRWAGLSSPPPHQGWTVFHLPSTPGTCEPFNPKPTAEIERGRPTAGKRDAEWAER